MATIKKDSDLNSNELGLKRINSFMTVHPNVKEQDRLTPDLPEFPTENQSVL